MKNTEVKPQPNRESWMIACLPLLQSLVFGPKGHTIPSDVKLSCSWPGGGSARKRIGECWPRSFSGAKVNELFISPVIADPVIALGIMVHELVHAIDDCKSGHKAPFRRIATSVGLTGKMTATTVSPELEAILRRIAEAVGPYPHSRLDLSQRKKQTGRNLKCVCCDPECGAVFRMTQSWVDRASELGMLCPVCHGAAMPE